MSPGGRTGERNVMAVITAHEEDQISKANASGLPPVVFVHGLWLLPSSWDRWATVFGEAGYVPLTPSWPDDPETVEEANQHPEVFAHKRSGMSPATTRTSSRSSTRSRPSS